jgi:PPK2 family polyphosphate:nucleotide phosphotransferase
LPRAALDCVMDLAALARRFVIDKPDKFRVADHDPGETCGLKKHEGKEHLSDASKRLTDLQEKLYAHDRWAVLVVLQAMDAAGKDGVIEHVMGAINPQGCDVHAFKQPSEEELSHDFLWRSAIRTPERGRIGIFNRSHYEEVLVVRVHPEYLAAQKLPAKPDGDEFWQERFRSIRGFESHLAMSGTRVLKFFLNISREEQRKRFLDRVDEPGKRWKFSMGDVEERKLWPRYMAAYEDAIRNTSTPDARWYVVPADHKWFTRLVVAAAMVDAMEQLKLEFPKVEGEALKRLLEAGKALEAEKPGQ